MSISAGSTKLPTLTGCRAFAAFAVFVGHAQFMLWGPTEISRWLGSAAMSGVEFFFILSGFILTWSANTREPVGPFWRRRIVKIYPNHVVAWALGLGAMAWAGYALSPGMLFPNLFLVQGWIPEYDVYSSVNGVSWSLSCELFFYLCFPLLLPAVRRIGPAQLKMWALLSVVAVVLVPLVASHNFANSPQMPGLGITWKQFWFSYTLPATRVFEFGLGILLARMVREGQLTFVRRRHALVALCVGLPVSTQVPYLYSISAVMALPLALTVVAVANADIARRPTLIGRPRAVWLGEISYAFYLVHQSVLVAAGAAFDVNAMTTGTVEKWAWFAGLLAVSVAVAALLYSSVERPAMRRFSRSPALRREASALGRGVERDLAG
ncbi:acyltransferase family protein [Streptomyces sp. NPDC001530]|uniref:acyltransferase family protein n=1 Tax=Streptomyces sp. NPDC001530 TaxID=3364582 RepID=UPI00368570C2